jgi:hypothetical protein
MIKNKPKEKSRKENPGTACPFLFINLRSVSVLFFIFLSILATVYFNTFIMIKNTAIAG